MIKQLLIGLLLGIAAVMVITAFTSWLGVAKAEWQEMDAVHRCAKEQVAMGIPRKDVRCDYIERQQRNTTRSK